MKSFSRSALGLILVPLFFCGCNLQSDFDRQYFSDSDSGTQSEKSDKDLESTDWFIAIKATPYFGKNPDANSIPKGEYRKNERLKIIHSGEDFDLVESYSGIRGYVKSRSIVNEKSFDAARAKILLE